jgi:YegS/Rv2252/BmrU family lipid kinase
MPFKNALIIYNPYSGLRNFKSSLDSCISVLSEAGYVSTVIRLSRRGMADEYFESLPDKNFFDAILTAGGDGTLNIVANAAAKRGVESPLAVIPAGTANDFARFLKMPKSPEACARIVAQGKIQSCDLGLANDRYFINVFAAGLLTSVAHSVDGELKSILGSLAYYMKGLEKFPSFEPIPFRVETDGDAFEEDLALFLILNGGGAGGFDKLAPSAQIDDGYLDLVAIKSGQLVDNAVLFFKILGGDYLNEPNIIYRRAKNIRIEPLSVDPTHRISDIDGEIGPILPADISILPSAVKFFVP